MKVSKFWLEERHQALLLYRHTMKMLLPFVALAIAFAYSIPFIFPSKPGAWHGHARLFQFSWATIYLIGSVVYYTWAWRKNSKGLKVIQDIVARGPVFDKQIGTEVEFYDRDEETDDA